MGYKSGGPTGAGSGDMTKGVYHRLNLPLVKYPGGPTLF